MNSKYHDDSTLMHYITLRAELEELKATGFTGETLVYEREGRALKVGDVARDDMSKRTVNRTLEGRPTVA